VPNHGGCKRRGWSLERWRRHRLRCMRLDRLLVERAQMAALSSMS
jgi:hypothetical protein